MRVTVLILALATLLSSVSSGVQAQQSDPKGFDNAFQGTFAKAQGVCKALWSDHAFDPLRMKIPLGEDKPTFAMLKNAEKLKAKDRPLADLAIKTLEKCRAAYTDLYAMLPPQASAMIHGVERQQDALVADLYRGKISFGEFNTSMTRLTGELASTLSGVQINEPDFSPRQADVPAAIKSAQQPKAEQKQNSSTTFSHEIRLALVVGNSGYINLPKLANPTNDARAVADVLQKMGYQTRLLLDASEQKMRREVRQFASDSTKADVALVFYAGHGAQVNGNNYLLPTDIDIPRTEVDIQFAGLKVDDLVNSIAANTKIVFLDACRDNPVLFKNLVKGRGSSPAGLAPASSSNFEQRAGGGVFIAYATDAGAVADDGNGRHSPFTQALLRNIQKPISIDDMFSFVTKEVRLVTKNAQRPYKYASLESIVCVAPNCSTNPANTTKPDVFQQAVQSEADDLQIALQTNNLEALETFLQKYPDSSKQSEVQQAIEILKRSEFTEWTLYEIGAQHLPQYIQLSSIRRLGDRAVAKTKHLLDSTEPTILFGKSFPGAAYQEQIHVKLGQVIKYDEVTDLALVRAADIPKGRIPIRLGDLSEAAIGADVSAIGHPDDQTWTFTKGIVSQYRIGFEWQDHKADVIQTQTPINPGNSGGPLISESGSLIGVNAFKRADSENLNFSVSVDEVKRFLARKGDRPVRSDETAKAKPACELKELSRFRSEKNDAIIIAYDTRCTGHANANYIVPDSKSKSIMYAIDRNDDGRPDVIFFDLKQRKRWDISFWDEKFEGHWTLVGYHPDGKMTPSSFESYDKFQSRVAAR